MGRSASLEVGNLRADVTSLIGRHAETDEVKRLFNGSRLVTLTGPGGVGKTRLARHVGRLLRKAFPDGVWIVPLAELTEPDLVAATVLSTVGPQRSAGTTARELVDFIGDRQLLLVLDNCEHLAEAAAALAAQLLHDCQQLCLLVTSRESLRIAGEVLYQVPPLALPLPGTSPGAARRYDAVALFHERAAVLGRDLSGTPADQDAVVSLCQRLEGLPLAIELAASSTRWLSLQQLLNRTENPLVALPTGNRGMPGRHESVRASLDYSYDLCSPAARRLWTAFSVFRGGSTLDAIEEVCSEARLDRSAVEPALFELVDKSIVVLDGSRYRMAETIRQYGAELLDPGDQVAVGAAHLRHFAAVVEDFEREWFGPDQAVLLTRMLADQANVRAALQLSLSRPEHVPVGLSTATALWAFWIGCGRPGEGRHWLDQLLAVADVSPAQRAPALWVDGFLSAVDGDVPASRRLLEECLSAAEAAGDEASSAHAIGALGVGHLFQGRIDEAIENLERCIELERRVDDAGFYFTDMLINLGLAHSYRGNVAEAHAVLEEAEATCRERGEELLRSWALLFSGLVRLLDSRSGEAAALVKEALAVKRPLHNDQGVIWAVEVLAWIELEQGHPERAAQLLGGSEARSADFGPVYHGFGAMVTTHDYYVHRTREHLGPDRYRIAFQRGFGLSMAELIAFALGEAGDDQRSADVAAPGLPLTRRELEIAELVARGMTNKEIAAELVIAVRTADTHVQNILGKLGFTSRSQVAALLATRHAVVRE